MLSTLNMCLKNWWQQIENKLSLVRHKQVGEQPPKPLMQKITILNATAEKLWSISREEGALVKSGEKRIAPDIPQQHWNPCTTSQVGCDLGGSLSLIYNGKVACRKGSLREKESLT